MKIGGKLLLLEKCAPVQAAKKVPTDQSKFKQNGAHRFDHVVVGGGRLIRTAKPPDFVIYLSNVPSPPTPTNQPARVARVIDRSRTLTHSHTLLRTHTLTHTHTLT